MPKDSSESISKRDLLGLEAIVTVDNLSDSNIGSCKAIDRNNNIAWVQFKSEEKFKINDRIYLKDLLSNDIYLASNYI